jgi:DNA-binding HxlR family transcriptional regulator
MYDYWWLPRICEELTHWLALEGDLRMRDRLYMCGVDVALTALGGRWRTVVLAAIRNGASGFAQLRREVPGISEKMLSASLRDLIAAGFVQRTEVRQRPLEVRYTMTNQGCQLGPALASLNDWGEAFASDHGLRIVQHPALEPTKRRRAARSAGDAA